MPLRLQHFGLCPEHVSEIERRRRIGWIAFHYYAVEALGLGNVSGLLSRLCLLKQIVGIVLRLIDRKYKLAVLIGSSLRLFDFEAVERAGMEPHIG